MKSIFFLLTFLASFVEAKLPGQDMFDMLVDQVALEPDVNKKIKSLFVPSSNAVRALQENDCSLLKEALHEVREILKNGLIVLSESIISQLNFDPQMSMMFGMVVKGGMEMLDKQIDHTISHQACSLALEGHDHHGGHEEFWVELRERTQRN